VSLLSIWAIALLKLRLATLVADTSSAAAFAAPPAERAVRAAVPKLAA
jgi:hypothetical protein